MSAIGSFPVGQLLARRDQRENDRQGVESGHCDTEGRRIDFLLCGVHCEPCFMWRLESCSSPLSKS